MNTLLPGFPPPPPVTGTANGLDVRVAAEFAADVRDTPLWFAFDDGPMIVSGTQLAPDLAPLPQVATSADADRPTLETLNLSLTSDPDLEIPGSQAGALFWSEAAVEKFLLPYYASVYGWEAAALLLEQVYEAFFGYNPEAVQVVALAYGWGSQSQMGPIALAGSIQVVYAEVAGGVLQLQPLRLAPLQTFVNTPDFIGTGPIVARTSADPAGPLGIVPFTRPPALDSIDLRELAEFARGVRGRYLYFQPLTEGVLVSACTGLERCAAVPQDAFTCATPLRRPDRPAPALVTATVAGATDPVTLLGNGSIVDAPPDAVFWNDGALEKLMLPYYASVMGRQAPFFLALLLGQWEHHIDVLPVTQHDDDTLAIQALQGIVAGTGPEPTSVFAVVHLPRSEYIPEALEDGGGTTPAIPPQGLADRTRLLRLDARGFHADPVRRR